MSHETYWQATGVEAPETPASAGDLTTEVLVVGAGFTGLNAALELAESGREVTVIDADELGGGASGRAGGFVSARFRMPQQIVAKRFGVEMVHKLQGISRDAVMRVEHNVEQYAIKDARLFRHGSITGAPNERHLQRLVSNANSNSKGSFGKPADLRILNREEIAAATGSPSFVGGTIAGSVLGIHPLNYLRGLANAALKLHVPIHANTRAERIRFDATAAIVETDRGPIRAKQVVMATNAYSRLTNVTRPLAQGVIPFRSAVIVTEPLSHNIAGSILPGGHMLVDTRRLLRWYRMIDGRLFVGGRGAGAPSGDTVAYERLRGCMLELYPHLKSTPIEYRWSGLIGVTLDELPHVGRVHERIVISGGCNGNGIAVSSLFGRYAARYAMGSPPDIGILDTDHMVRLPLHRFSGPAVRMGTQLYEFLDRIGV